MTLNCCSICCSLSTYNRVLLFFFTFTAVLEVLNSSIKKAAFTLQEGSLTSLKCKFKGEWKPRNGLIKFVLVIAKMEATLLILQETSRLVW